MIDRTLPARLWERAAQLTDRLLGINPVFGMAMRRVARTGDVGISDADRERMMDEAVVEVRVVGKKITLRPSLSELAEGHHVDEIAQSTSPYWRVTNTYETDLFDRPISTDQGYLNTIVHYACPVELCRDRQQYKLGWDAFAQALGLEPVLMSLNDFKQASERAIESTLTPEGARYFRMLMW